MVIDVGILGAGRMAHALVAALESRETTASPSFRLGCLWARRPSEARRRTERVGHFDDVSRCAVVFLAVRDSSIRAVAARLASLDLARVELVVHAAGALGVEALAPLRGTGPALGVLHPLISLPGFGAADPLRRARCVLHGQAAARVLLERLARHIEVDGVWVEALDTRSYHAAAALASNGVTALIDAAGRLLGDASAGRLGLDEARSLAASALRALETATPVDALTGPVRRGDVDVVRAHVDALREHDSSALYREVMRAALGLARRAGLDPAEAKHIDDALDAERA